MIESLFFKAPLLFLIAHYLICLPDKALKEILDQVLLSGYFDRVPAHQNGVCEEEEEEEPASAAVAAAAVVAAESSEAEEQTVDPGPWLFSFNSRKLETTSIFRSLMQSSNKEISALNFCFSLHRNGNN